MAKGNRIQAGPFSEYDDTYLSLWAALHDESKPSTVAKAVIDWVELNRKQIDEQLESYARIKGVSRQDAIKLLLNDDQSNPDETKPE